MSQSSCTQGYQAPYEAMAQISLNDPKYAGELSRRMNGRISTHMIYDLLDFVNVKITYPLLVNLLNIDLFT